MATPTITSSLVYSPRRREADWISLAWLLTIPLWLISGCTAVSVGVVKPTPLRTLIETTHRFANAEYIIAPGDDLTVRLYFNPQLDEDLRVRPDGHISLSLIGEVVAAGKTPTELSAAITSAYSQYFLKSNSVVIVRRPASERIFTAGEVRNPGQFDLAQGAQTVLQSIAASGGVTDNATLDSVILVRRLPGQIQPMVVELDLRRALSGKEPQQDLALMPNDLVYVPKSGAADLNLAVHLFLLNNLNLTTGVSAGHNF
jgi:protein involved in polysaccharide export with SLBB domain